MDCVETHAALKGRSILVVEDVALIALDLEYLLASAGAQVFGRAFNVAKAMKIIDKAAHIDGALLDVKLAGEPSLAIAYRLKEKGIPFVFLTSWGHDVIPADLRPVPVIGKPYEASKVLHTLAGLLSPRRSAIVHRRA